MHYLFLFQINGDLRCTRVHNRHFIHNTIPLTNVYVVLCPPRFKCMWACSGVHVASLKIENKQVFNMYFHSKSHVQENDDRHTLKNAFVRQLYTVQFQFQVQQEAPLYLCTYAEWGSLKIMPRYLHTCRFVSRPCQQHTVTRHIHASHTHALHHTHTSRTHITMCVRDVTQHVHMMCDCVWSTSVTQSHIAHICHSHSSHRYMYMYTTPQAHITHNHTLRTHISHHAPSCSSSRFMHASHTCRTISSMSIASRVRMRATRSTWTSVWSSCLEP